MMEAEPFGHLLINGRQATVQEIAILTVTPASVVRKSLEELDRNGVYSKTDDGTIYSRRMVRDAEKAREMQRRGKLGGNPTLNQRGQPENAAQLNQQDKQDTKTTSFSSPHKPHGNNHSQCHSHSSEDSNESSAPAKPSHDPVKDLWDRGLHVLGAGRSARSLLAKLRNEYGDPAVLEAIVACETKIPSDPAAYLLKCLANRRAANGGLLPNEGVF